MHVLVLIARLTERFLQLRTDDYLGGDALSNVSVSLDLRLDWLCIGREDADDEVDPIRRNPFGPCVLLCPTARSIQSLKARGS